MSTAEDRPVGSFTKDTLRSASNACITSKQAMDR